MHEYHVYMRVMSESGHIEHHCIASVDAETADAACAMIAEKAGYAPAYFIAELHGTNHPEIIAANKALIARHNAA